MRCYTIITFVTKTAIHTICCCGLSRPIPRLLLLSSCKGSGHSIFPLTVFVATPPPLHSPRPRHSCFWRASTVGERRSLCSAGALPCLTCSRYRLSLRIVLDSNICSNHSSDSFILFRAGWQMQMLEARICLWFVRTGAQQGLILNFIRQGFSALWLEIS